MITEDMVREGIRNGSVRFVRDPNMDHGTVCQIGDNWFYFGHLKAEELDPDEYVKATPRLMWSACFATRLTSSERAAKPSRTSTHTMKPT